MIDDHRLIEWLAEPLAAFVRETTDDEVMSNEPNRPDKWKRARSALRFYEVWRSEQPAPGIFADLGSVAAGVAGAIDHTVRDVAATVGGAAQGVADAAKDVARG